MNTPGRGYAPKITASNSLQLLESQILAKNTMNYGSSENQRIKGQIRCLRGQDLLYGPPWAHCLGGYQDRLLGGLLELPNLCRTVPDGMRRKDYGGEVLG
jgi:hypothetical protein